MEQIRKALAAKTRSQIAAEIGVTPGALTLLFSGQRNPSAEMCRRLARYCKVTPGQILDYLDTEIAVAA